MMAGFGVEGLGVAKHPTKQPEPTPPLLWGALTVCPITSLMPIERHGKSRAFHEPRAAAVFCDTEILQRPPDSLISSRPRVATLHVEAAKKRYPESLYSPASPTSSPPECQPPTSSRR